jgi:hypothetical protein
VLALIAVNCLGIQNTVPPNGSKVGMNVSVIVRLDRDGSPRAFLVPQTGPNTASGILLDPIDPTR